MRSDKNLTLVLLTYAHGRVRISGQHEETTIVRHGGAIERINTMDLGFPLGLEADIAAVYSPYLCGITTRRWGRALHRWHYGSRGYAP